MMQSFLDYPRRRKGNEFYFLPAQARFAQLQKPLPDAGLKIRLRLHSQRRTLAV
jgi:hypothetical protein